MNVSVLIIAHNQIGQVILDTATAIIGSCPIPIEVMSIPMDKDTEELKQQANSHIKNLDKGDGVLVITDMYGSTPSNIANALRNSNVGVVAGLNLPMLIRVMNYPRLSLNELIEKAVSGSHDSIIACMPDEG